jgi:hypothetical protein
VCFHDIGAYWPINFFMNRCLKGVIDQNFIGVLNTEKGVQISKKNIKISISKNFFIGKVARTNICCVYYRRNFSSIWTEIKNPSLFERK